MSGQALYHSLNLTGAYSANERALLAALAYYVGKDSNQCSPGRKKLREKSGLSEHHLTKTLKALVEKKLITVGQRRDPKEKWRNTSNVYTLLYVPKARAGSVEAEGVDIWRLGV